MPFKTLRTSVQTVAANVSFESGGNRRFKRSHPVFSQRPANLAPAVVVIMKNVNPSCRQTDLKQTVAVDSVQYAIDIIIIEI